MVVLSHPRNFELYIQLRQAGYTGVSIVPQYVRLCRNVYHIRYIVTLMVRCGGVVTGGIFKVQSGVV